MSSLIVGLSFAKGGAKTSDWTCLQTFPALKMIMIDGASNINDSMVETLLSMPHLARLEFHNLTRWQGSVVKLGLLRARLAAQRPGCCMQAYD